jgi:hypothetical protein
MGLRLCSLRLSAEEPIPAGLARDSPGELEARDTPSRFRDGPLGARADLMPLAERVPHRSSAGKQKPGGLSPKGKPLAHFFLESPKIISASPRIVGLITLNKGPTSSPWHYRGIQSRGA